MQARYQTIKNTDKFMLIEDVGHNEGKSVTNDAERVVSELIRRGLSAPKKLFYIDSSGDYGELKFNGSGFCGFGPATKEQTE